MIPNSIVGIDPGPVRSAWVSIINGHVQAEHGCEPNEDVLERIADCGAEMLWPDTVVIEMIACYGMPVGREVFETCVWIGRFIGALTSEGVSVHRLTRGEVKMNLCGSMRAKDANIRQALIDRLGPPGTKKHPGGTYGLKGDEWAALAVAVTFLDLRARDGGTDAEGDRDVQGVAEVVAQGRLFS